MTVDLDRLEALVAAMTSGPWRHSIEGRDFNSVLSAGDDAYIAFDASLRGAEFKPEDAAGIVALVNAAPELIATIRQMQRDYQMLVDAIDPQADPNVPAEIRADTTTPEWIARYARSTREWLDKELDAMDAAERELERWRHEETVEGDFVCPNELEAANLRQELSEARAEIERFKRPVIVHQDGALPPSALYGSLADFVRDEKDPESK